MHTHLAEPTCKWTTTRSIHVSLKMFLFDLKAFQHALATRLTANDNKLRDLKISHFKQFPTVVVKPNPPTVSGWVPLVFPRCDWLPRLPRLSPPQPLGPWCLDDGRVVGKGDQELVEPLLLDLGAWEGGAEKFHFLSAGCGWVWRALVDAGGLHDNRAGG